MDIKLLELQNDLIRRGFDVDIIGANTAESEGAEMKILVVNDNTDIINVLEHEFKLLEYPIVTALDGKQALEALEKNPDIKLILCDYAMPEMDGPEFRKEQIQSHPKIPFVLMCNQVHIADKAAELEAAGYLDMMEALGERGLEKLRKLVSEHALS